MGQKVHPYGFRLGIIRESKSKWFAEGKKFREQLIEDIKIRRFVLQETKNASVADVLIERAADTIIVTISTAKPGVIIGRGGRDVDILRQRIEQFVGKGQKVRVNVEETKDPDLCAQLVADNIARQIERRVSYRRAMRQAVDRAMKLGAKGIRVKVSGRLGGAEIARSEGIGPEGRVPLQTLRADIDYGVAEAKTGYGHIGVKVWVYRGEVLPPKKETRAAAPAAAAELESLTALTQPEAPVAAEPAAPTAVATPAVEPEVKPAEAPVGPPALEAAPAPVEPVELVAPEDDELLAALSGEDFAEESEEAAEGPEEE